MLSKNQNLQARSAAEAAPPQFVLRLGQHVQTVVFARKTRRSDRAGKKHVTSPPSGGTEKAVAALEQQWLQGQKTNNPDLVAPLLADKIVVTEADGKVSDKAGTLAFYKNTKWDSAEYDDVKVTVFGDTAMRPEASKVKAPMRWESLSIIMSGGPTRG